MSHFGIITAGDVIAEQQRTLASANATNQAVQGCTTMDAGTKSQWAAFYAAITVWCNTPIINFWTPWAPDNSVVVTGDTGDTMMAYEAQLQAWQQKIAGACKNVPPGLSEFGASPAGEQASQALRWIAIIAGFVGTAYVVGKVVSLIPTASQRAAMRGEVAPSQSTVTRLLPARKNPVRRRRIRRAA